jgi:hypothetical protein
MDQEQQTPRSLERPFAEVMAEVDAVRPMLDAWLEVPGRLAGVDYAELLAFATSIYRRTVASAPADAAQLPPDAPTPLDDETVAVIQSFVDRPGETYRGVITRRLGIGFGRALRRAIEESRATPAATTASAPGDTVFDWYRQQQAALATILDAFTAAWPGWYHGGVPGLPGLIQMLADESNAYRANGRQPAAPAARTSGDTSAMEAAYTKYSGEVFDENDSSAFDYKAGWRGAKDHSFEETGSPSQRDLLDTLVGVLNVVGYTSDYACMHPTLTVSECVAQLLEERVPTRDRRHVGDSNFEPWYQAYAAGGETNPKQISRDSYAAGMGDTTPQPQARGPLTEDDVERQYRDGTHIGTGLPRATCPCGFCMKHLHGFNRGDATARPGNL